MFIVKSNQFGGNTSALKQRSRQNKGMNDLEEFVVTGFIHRFGTSYLEAANIANDETGSVGIGCTWCLSREGAPPKSNEPFQGRQSTIMKYTALPNCNGYNDSHLSHIITCIWSLYECLHFKFYSLHMPFVALCTCISFRLTYLLSVIMLLHTLVPKHAHDMCTHTT